MHSMNCFNVIGYPVIFFLNGNSSSLKLYTTVVVVGGAAVTVLDVDGAADSSAGSPRLDDEEEVLESKIHNGYMISRDFGIRFQSIQVNTAMKGKSGKR